MMLNSIQSKCVSNVTKGITNNSRNESSLPLTTVIATTLHITKRETIITTTTTTLFVETLTLTSTYPSTNAPTNEISTITTTTYSIERTTLRFTTDQVQTTGTPIPSVCNNSPFQILPYTYLNSQAIQDFKIEIITGIKLEPVRQSVTCACASRCQQTKNCVYFKSYPYYLVNGTNCYLYEFKSPIIQTLKNNLQRGIYYSQDSNIASGIPKILFS